MVVKTDGPEKARTFKLITLRQLVHCTCRPNIAVNMEKENVTDRELFSELFENPIHPLQIHMVPPFVDENSPTFHLQIHGEEVYRCREICGKLATVFNLLQLSVKPLGYQFEESAQDRIRHRNRGKHSAILAKDPNPGGRKKEKKLELTETWIKLAIKLLISAKDQ